jgi:hypothetical protein
MTFVEPRPLIFHVQFCNEEPIEVKLQSDNTVEDLLHQLVEKVHADTRFHVITCENTNFKPDELLSKFIYAEEEEPGNTNEEPMTIELKLKLTVDGWKQRRDRLRTLTEILADIRRVAFDIDKTHQQLMSEEAEKLHYEYHGQYVIVEGKPQFTIEEELVHIDAQAVIEAFVPNADLILPVKDYFNDKINFDVRNVADMKRLNDEMLPVVVKFVELYQVENNVNNPPMKNVLLSFLNNYIGLYQNYWNLRELLHHDESKLFKLRQVQNEINKKLALLLKEQVGFEGGYLNLQSSKIDLKPPMISALAAWIPTKHMKLLYRRSRHGATPDAFHRLCDNQGPTLVLIQSTTDHIFGGFANTPWTSNNAFSNNPGGFIFTLFNPYNMPPTQFVYNNNGNGIYGGKDCGPIFGGGNDIYIDRTIATVTFTPNSYPITGGRGNAVFAGASPVQVKEMEVWKVESR